MTFKWLFAGTDSLCGQQFSSVKLVNSLTIPALLVIIAQLPVVIFFTPDNLSFILGLIGFGLLVVLMLPQCSRRLSPHITKWLLLFSFLLFISASSVLWQTNLNSHYFLLIGIFVIGFIFPDSQNIQFWCANSIYLIAFIGLGAWFQETLNSAGTATLVLVNDITMFLLAVLCSCYVRFNNDACFRKATKTSQIKQSILINTLPEHIISLLSEQRPKTFYTHQQITVLFADMSGFTDLCVKQTTLDTVRFLDEVYSGFDRIGQQYGMEKIKTNGDQYIAVAGLSNASENAAIRVCRYAMAIRKFFAQVDVYRSNPLGLRIGIASGSAVSGVIGRNIFCFDIWGDAVNKAALLERNAKNNAILVCDATRTKASERLNFSNAVSVADKQNNALNSYYLVEYENNETNHIL